MAALLACNESIDQFTLAILQLITASPTVLYDTEWKKHAGGIGLVTKDQTLRSFFFMIIMFFQKKKISGKLYF